MKTKKDKTPVVLVATGYADKLLDCPEWLQGAVCLQYLGIPDKNKILFDNGHIGIEWDCSESSKWWRFCNKR